MGHDVLYAAGVEVAFDGFRAQPSYRAGPFVVATVEALYKKAGSFSEPNNLGVGHRYPALTGNLHGGMLNDCDVRHFSAVWLEDVR